MKEINLGKDNECRGREIAWGIESRCELETKPKAASKILMEESLYKRYTALKVETISAWAFSLDTLYFSQLDVYSIIGYSASLSSCEYDFYTLNGTVFLSDVKSIE